MIAENRRARAHLDMPLILLVSAMSIFGVLAVCVATYSTTSTAETWLAHIVESSSAMRQVFSFKIFKSGPGKRSCRLRRR